MPNVRLLRQSIEDYQKKYDTTAKNFNGKYDEYKAGVDTYNAEMDKLIANLGSVAYVSNPDGTYTRVISTVEGLKYHRGEAPPNIKGVTKLPDTRPSGSDFILLTEGPNKGVYTWGYQGDRWGWSPMVDKVSTVPTPIYTQPVAPKEPDPIKPPNITVSGSRELQNPGLNQSQLNMSSARGILGKSNLAGDLQPAMRDSAFADPSDPNGLKDRGVLARVLGGQL